MALSEEQVRTFFRAAAGDRLEALYVLALTTGMREGELLALRWKDIDLDTGLLQVRTTVQRAENSFIIAQPETAHSRCRIALSHLGIEALRAHQIRQEKERKALGDIWNTTYDLVFPNTLGKILKPSNLSQILFQRLLRKAGLPEIRFHDLRHTAATTLLSRGVNPKIVSEMLGHSQISITLDIYSHVTPHMQQMAADTMDTMYGESEK